MKTQNTELNQSPENLSKIKSLTSDPSGNFVELLAKSELVKALTEDFCGELTTVDSISIIEESDLPNNLPVADIFSDVDSKHLASSVLFSAKCIQEAIKKEFSYVESAIVAFTISGEMSSDANDLDLENLSKIGRVMSLIFVNEDSGEKFLFNSTDFLWDSTTSDTSISACRETGLPDLFKNSLIKGYFLEK